MLTLERLKGLLHYDPETGIFTWKIKITTNKLNSAAGHFDKDGYLRIQIDNKIYRSHRLAWLYVYGKWPEKDLDHKDTIKTHNWISNLREAVNAEQKFNTAAHRNNKLGVKGIGMIKNKFRARITGPNGLYTIGDFNTLDEAKKAYAQEALKVHNKFIHKSVEENL